MIFRLTPLFTLLVAGTYVILMLAGTAQAFNHPKFRKTSLKTVPNRYIVEFNSASRIEATDGHTNLKRFFLRSVRKNFKRANVLVKRDFTHELFNGLTIDVTGLNDHEHHTLLNHIGGHADVISIYPVAHIPRPKTSLEKRSKRPDIDVSALLPHKLTQVDRVHSVLNNRGKGVIVGIVDSGVDYKHPALGGGFGPGFKIAYGADLVGDAYNSADDDPIVKPGPTPYDDCPEGSSGGHGTHVSGIVAGNDTEMNFVGVAPEATLGMWRVFGCSGSTSDEYIAKGILMAYEAGSDIISLSLGELTAWGNTLSSVIVDRISQRGVYVIVAAGNSGTYGAFSVGDPSTAADAVSVASFNNMNILGSQFTTSGSIASTITYQASNATKNKLPSAQIVAGDKNIGSNSDACSPSTIPTNLKGNLALVQRGTCTFDVKYKNVVNAGAVGVIFYNSASGGPADSSFVPALTAKNPVAAGISNQDGQALVNALKKGTVAIKSVNEVAIVPFGSGADQVSDFSSVGPSYDLKLKPNIAGVGGSIFSTLPLVLGGWGVMSGTSMATPYVSGSIALYLNSLGSNEKKVSAQYGIEQFQNYAFTASPTNGNQTSIDNPVSQGAGLVQVFDTIKGTLHVSPGQLSFNDSSARNDIYKKQQLTIFNNGQSSVTLQAINNVSVAILPYNIEKTGYVMTDPARDSIGDSANIQFSSSSITISPGQNQTITVTLTPPSTEADLHVIYGGYIQFKSSDANVTNVHVPYYGIAGDQRQLPIFAIGTPVISDLLGKKIYQQNQTFVVNRKNQETAGLAIVAQLVSPSNMIISEVLDASNGTLLGLSQAPVLGASRNMLNDSADDNELTPYLWDGTYIPTYVNDTQSNIPVKDGTYRLRLRALKWLGDPGNADDFEVWESGPITVQN